MNKNLFNKLYWLGTLLFWLVTFSAWIVTPESIILNSALLVIGLALIGIRIFWDRENFKKLALEINPIKLMSLFMTIFLSLSILGVLNYIFYKKQTRWELISNRKLDLSEQTKILIKSLGKTKMTLITKRERWGIFFPILQRVKALNPDIEFEARDIDLEPTLAQKYKLDQIDALLFEQENKRVTTYFSEKKRIEETLLNALLKMSQKKSHVITFSQGHGEYSILDEGNQGLSFLKEKLEEQNFIVTSVDLSREEIAPEISMLVLWEPKRLIEESELEKIKKFLIDGGKLFVAKGPSFGTRDYFENIRTLLLSWDIETKNMMLIDKLSTVEGMEATISQITTFNENHPVTKNFKGKMYLPLAAPLFVTQNHSDKRAVSMAQSAPFPGVWAEKDLQGILRGEAIFNEGQDIKGPLSVMASSQEVEAPFSSIIYIGSSSFALNNYSAQAPQFNLLLNAISWQLGLGEMILNERENLKREPIILSQRHLYLVFYFVVLLLPLLSFMMAFWCYLRRRRL